MALKDLEALEVLAPTWDLLVQMELALMELEQAQRLLRDPALGLKQHRVQRLHLLRLLLAHLLLIVKHRQVLAVLLVVEVSREVMLASFQLLLLLVTLKNLTLITVTSPNTCTTSEKYLLMSEF